ncbi:MAG TPA: hypothetical protein VIU12_18155 [Chryseolinea sp.]
MIVSEKLLLTNRIIHAIDNNLKIQFRLRSTPAGNYILFHPYSVLKDELLGKEKVYGLLEMHYYADAINNKLCCIFIDKLAELIILETPFHKPSEWRSRIDSRRYSENRSLFSSGK